MYQVSIVELEFVPMQLGAVIEEVTGMTLGEFFKKRIFDPLGMSNTSFDIERENVDRLAPCFRFTGKLDRSKSLCGISILLKYPLQRSGSMR